jgi:hypothetical protein
MRAAWIFWNWLTSAEGKDTVRFWLLALIAATWAGWFLR